MGSPGLNLGQLHARQASCLLYYASSPKKTPLKRTNLFFFFLNSALKGDPNQIQHSYEYMRVSVRALRFLCWSRLPTGFSSGALFGDNWVG